MDNQNQKHVSFLKLIENYGQLIIIFISSYILFYKITYFNFYILGLLFNTIINSLLKYLIKEPRPSKQFLKEVQNSDLIFPNAKYDMPSGYGMPSGHAQNLGYSLGFMFIFIKNSDIFWVYIIVSIITIFQRYTNKKHTILQLILGFIFGLLIGILFYKLGKYFLQGKISKKVDDYAFINF
jgi:membrane-associated phospholipid phosphatase